MFGRKDSVAVRIDGKEVAVPVGVMRMIAAVARLAEGRAVAMTVEEDVSPQEAAEILNVVASVCGETFRRGSDPEPSCGNGR